jgi:flagellar biosynthetic protein FlhB
MEGKDGKTERATPKKRSDARSKGNVCLSQDVTTCCVLLCGLIGMRLMVPQMFVLLQQNMRDSFALDRVGEWSGDRIQTWMISSCMLMLRVMSPVMVGVVIGTVSGSMLQTKPFFSMKALKMKFSGLNPVTGIGKLFSMQSVVGLGTSLLKVALIMFVAYKVVGNHTAVLYSMPEMPSILSVQWVLGLIFKLTAWVVFLFISIALIDWIHKRYQHEKGIMMTKQEVKDEIKQQDVNPIVKRALAKKRLELSVLRMMSAVPSADVIVTNPTHVAIAIQYDPENMNAPRVVAKGLRLVAKRIKKIALKNNIPIVERPPLARAIYKSVKVGNEIPSKFYEAIATVLAYLHKIGRGIGTKRGGPKT